MADKFLYVSCIIKDTGIYDLLQAMGVHKIGNLEVRAVAPLLALPPPEKTKRKYAKRAKAKRNKRGALAAGTVRDRVKDAMTIGEPINVSELAKKLDTHPGSVNSVVVTMVNHKLAKKLGPGQFVRIKPEQTNGAAA